MKPIPVAIIGAGRWGRNLIRNLQQSPAFALQGVYDIDPVQLEGISAPHVSDLATLYDRRDLRAVVIATPPSTHAALVENFLTSGKHVLCEKPLALSVTECHELMILAQSQGLCLMVDCTPCYLEEIQAAQAGVAWERVRSIECVRTSKSVPISIEHLLWDLAPHDLAILRSWLGNLEGHWSIQSLSSESIVLERICPRNPSISIELGTSNQPRREITVLGDFQPIVYRQQQAQPEPLRVVIEQFAKCIRDGTPPSTDAAGALETARILEQICAAFSFRDTRQKISGPTQLLQHSEGK